MKRTVQIAAVCLLLLLLPLTAMAAEQEDLPIEYVSYGYGLPDPAPVPSHGLTDQNLTLEGIRYEQGWKGSGSTFAWRIWPPRSCCGNPGRGRRSWGWTMKS